METVIAPMVKSNLIEFPIINLIEERRSLRAYSSRMIEPEKIDSLFEAARWAPSSVNEQPWVYLYATKDQVDLWSKLLNTLVEGNRVWAEQASLLVLSLVRKNFSRNDRPNGSAKYDLGAANAFLSLQATELGLNVHQMGGFDKQQAIDNLQIPETHEPVVMLAIGYPGTPESLSENLKARELAPRERNTQEFFVMNKTF